MALAALAAIERGVGVIMIDPKPDEFLLGLLRDAAGRAGRRFAVGRQMAAPSTTSTSREGRAAGAAPR
jgi:hypothetical protein